MLEKNIKYVLVLAALSWMVFTMPTVRAALTQSVGQSSQTSAIGSVLSLDFKDAQNMRISWCHDGYVCMLVSQLANYCPSGYTCIKSTPPPTPNPQPTPISGPCYAFTQNLGIGSTGPDVIVLQTYLLANGFSIPNIASGSTAKGRYDSQTAAAVARYQSAMGLSATGNFDVVTRAKVNSLPCSTPVTCPAGYTCGTVSTTTPVTTPCPVGFIYGPVPTPLPVTPSCPAGYTCTPAPGTPSRGDCPAGYICSYPTTGTTSVPSTTCPAGYTCTIVP